MNEIYNLTTLTKYLNETYKKKKSGVEFRVADVQNYVRRGYLPRYLGNVTIVTLNNLPTKMYKLKVKNNV